MTETQFDLITIGESLVEFSTNQTFKDAECLHKYYGGDSLVVAIAAKRLNSKVGFVSCLGNDVLRIIYFPVGKRRIGYKACKSRR